MTDRETDAQGTSGFSRTVKSPVTGPYTNLFPFRENVITQTGRGRLEVVGAVLRAGSVPIGRLQLSVPAAGHMVPEPGWLTFMAPLRWQGTHMFNGEVATPGVLFLSSSPDGYFSSGGARDTVGAGVRRARFIETLAALRGVDPERVGIVDGALQLDPARAASLRRTLLGALDTATRRGWVVLPTEFAHAIEDRVVCALIDAYLSARPYLDLGRVFTLPALTIARRAEEFLRQAADETVTMAQLCAATGVGTTALNAAFHEVYGQPPLKFLRLRRLMQVRNDLLQTSPHRSAVKRTALRHGFVESGRFAHAYYRLFGELPSVTLERSIG